MRVHAISGYGVKGPACFLVETQGRRFLLDLGEGPAAGVFPDVSGIGPVDAILISHSHADHVGGLHLAETLGAPAVHATAATAALIGAKLKAPVLPLPLSGSMEVADVTVDCGRAGHSPGGIWMRIGGADGLLYTGDHSDEGPLYPDDPMLPARLMIVDASYGAYDTPLESAVPAVMERLASGPVLLPTQPAGRGLEMAVTLHEAGIAIGLCPTHIAAAELCMASPEPLLRDGARERLAAALSAARRLDADSPPEDAMLAGNGAASGGVSGALFRRFVDDTSIAIVFTGHVEPATPQSAMIESGRAAFLRWNVHPTLSSLRRLVREVKPSAVMPAFLPADKIAALREAAPEVVFVGAEMS